MFMFTMSYDYDDENRNSTILMKMVKTTVMEKRNS